MALFNFKKKPEPQQTRSVQYVDGSLFTEMLGCGYKTLDQSPEVVAACYKIAQLISSMTIYLMRNTEKGDKRIVNELSRKLDIEPNAIMTRSQWMSAIVMNLLLYGDGNSIVYPHTKNGLIVSLEPIEAERVGFAEVVGREDYRIIIDGKQYKPNEVLHFTLNPDKHYLWHGTGFRVQLKDIVDTLQQARATEKAFMNSKWKPSIIVKVDAMADEFSSPEGRSKLVNDYIKSGKAGEPWLIPAEQFQVEQIRPLSLADLAVNDTVQLDKKAVASVLGVPAFLLGVGSYNEDEWNSFISNTIRPIAQSIEQEMTRKLILSPKMYVHFNVAKLYSYDIQKISTVYGGLYDKGIMTGNEVREKLDLHPLEGLDKLIVLENYIPVEDVGNQKKLN